MDASANDPSGEMTAVLDWWREAGVDCAFDDAPRQWIVAREPPDLAEAPVDPNSFPAVKARVIAAVPSARAMIGGDPARWPAELAAFAEWWMSEPSLDHGQVRGRVAPRGPVAAPLMVLVCEPEADDGDALLSGPQGRLLGAMLSAMGLRDEQIYLASALPRHTPMVDWRDLAAQGLGEVLAMHIALARPQRIIAFGRHLPPLLTTPALDLPLPGNAPTQTDAVLRHFTQEGFSVPLLVARDLGALLERPIAKGQFWQHWLEWSSG